MNALAAHPVVGQLLASDAGTEAGKCHGRTCGGMGYFAVALMFLVLCGGVWLLLQSSFGPLQAYLVSSVAFWGCWFVLALIWFTGVPNVRIDYIPGIRKEIPRSTPRYYGPQGGLPSWSGVSAADQQRLAAREGYWVDAEGSQRQSDVDQIKAAETAAVDLIAKHYADELKVNATTITVPQIVEITKREIARGGGGIEYVKLTSSPAKAGPTLTADQQDLLAKIKPATFVLNYDPGTEAQPTLIALPLTFGLMAIHLVGLMWYERRYRPQPMSGRQRERETAGAGVA